MSMHMLTGLQFKILWYHIRHRAMMSTKLEKIESIKELSISPERVEES